MCIYLIACVVLYVHAYRHACIKIFIIFYTAIYLLDYHNDSHFQNILADKPLSANIPQADNPLSANIVQSDKANL